MLYLYDSKTTDFTNNGEPIRHSYDEHVIRDEGFYLNFKLLLDKNNHYKRVKKEMIVSADTPDGKNQFRVYDVVKHGTHVEITAVQMMYDFDYKQVKPIALYRGDGTDAINAFRSAFKSSLGQFTLSSNVGESHDFNTNDKDDDTPSHNALEVLNSITRRWDSELMLNGYDIRMVKRLGKKTDALLYEKKNISEFEDESSIRNLITRIHATATYTPERPEGAEKDPDEVVISVTVDSPLINQYAQVYEAYYQNNDARTEKELTDWVKLKYSTENVDKPSRTIEVKTNIIDGTEINYGDELVLKYLVHDVDEVIRCVGYDYDPIRKTYYGVTLGSHKESFETVITGPAKQATDKLAEDIQKQVQIIQYAANGKNRSTTGPLPVPNPIEGDMWWYHPEGRPDEVELRIFQNGEWVAIPTANRKYVDDEMKKVEERAQELEDSIRDTDLEVDKLLKDVGINTDLANKGINLATSAETKAILAGQKADTAFNRIIETNQTLDAITGEFGEFIREYEETEKGITERLTAIDKSGGRLAIAETELIRLAGEVTQRYTKTEITGLLAGKASNSQLADMATKTWANAEIKTSADGIKTDLTKVIKNEVEGIQIGGTNLIAPNSFSIFPKLVNYQGAVKSLVRNTVDMRPDWGFDGLEEIRIEFGNAVNDSLGVYWNSDNIIQKKNQQYSYSIYVKNTGSVPIRMHMNGLNGPDSPYPLIINAGQSGRFKFTGTRRDEYPWFQTWIGRVSPEYKSIQFIIGYEQLEEGTVVTQWKTPEADLATKTDITTLNTQINTEAGRIEQLITQVKTNPTGTITGYNQLVNTHNSMQQAIGTNGEKIANMVLTSSAYQLTIANLDIMSRVAGGLQLYDDPTFLRGSNGISAYARSGASISVTREAAPNGSQPTGSNYRLKIVSAGDSADIGAGGIQQISNSRINAEFVIRFIALLPVGRTFQYANNSIGDGNIRKWLTDNKGTGKWEEYAYYYKCGTGGTFSNFGHLFVPGNSAVTWYLAKHETFDISNSNQTQFSQLNQTISGIQGIVADKADKSTVTQLSNQWALTLKSGNDVKTAINATTNGVRIKSNLIHLDGDTLLTNAFARKLVVDTLTANDITAYMAKFGSVIATNIDANRITVNRAQMIQAGFNAINSSLTITGQDLRYYHSDGSQTVLSANGLETRLVVGGTPNFYKTRYLTDFVNVKGLNHDGSNNNYLWVNLPAVYKGKRFKVYCVVSDTYGVLSQTDYFSTAIQRIVAYVQQDKIDYANARIPLVGYATHINVMSGARTQREIQVVLIADL